MGRRSDLSHRTYRRIREQVLREEPVCQLRFAEICTYVSTQVDHIISPLKRPELRFTRGNLRGVCAPCNRHRSDKGTEPTRTRSDAMTFFD